MKPIKKTRALWIAPVLLLLLGACHKEFLQPEEVMNRIEKAVQLPAGATPLGAYDRYYAFSGLPGQIKGIYVEALNQSATRKRSWFDDRKKLPFMFDDGCRRVTVLYDEPRNRFDSVACSGARGA